MILMIVWIIFHSIKTSCFVCRFLQRKLLGNVKYCDEDDDTFQLGRVHRDEGVLPKKDRLRIRDTYSNYVRVERGEEKGASSNRIRYCNTFILSSWWPGAKENFNKPMMVTYNEKKERASVADEKCTGSQSRTPATTAPAGRGAEGYVENKRNHPKLEPRNLTIALLLGYALQGAQNAYYCGSWTTPGNGHDLSLLSGFCVAESIAPGSYPFSSDKAARDDFVQMSRLMNLGASFDIPIWTLIATVVMVFLFATLLFYW